MAIPFPPLRWRGRSQRGPESPDRVAFDGVVVVGAGLAGLSAALAAAPRRVVLLSSGELGRDCSSAWAQGGMAAALAGDDDPALHAADTIAAGAGLCAAGAVEILTREGPAAIRALAALGAPFDRTDLGAFALSLEAAHSRARVARVGGDGTGAAITGAAASAARAANHITIAEGYSVRALLLDRSGRARGVLARHRGRWILLLSDSRIDWSGIRNQPPGSRS